VCIIDELLSHILSYVKKKSEEENTEKCWFDWINHRRNSISFTKSSQVIFGEGRIINAKAGKNQQWGGSDSVPRNSFLHMFLMHLVIINQKFPAWLVRWQHYHHDRHLDITLCYAIKPSWFIVVVSFTTIVTVNDRITTQYRITAPTRITALGKEEILAISIPVEYPPPFSRRKLSFEQFCFSRI